MLHWFTFFDMVDPFAACFEKLFNDPLLRETMSARSREIVHSQFSSEFMVERFKEEFCYAENVEPLPHDTEKLLLENTRIQAEFIRTQEEAIALWKKSDTLNSMLSDRHHAPARFYSATAEWAHSSLHGISFPETTTPGSHFTVTFVSIPSFIFLRTRYGPLQLLPKLHIIVLYISVQLSMTNMQLMEIMNLPLTEDL